MFLVFKHRNIKKYYFLYGILFVILILQCNFINGQQKINDGTIPATPRNADAIIEFQTTKKGMLLPRLALTSTVSATPLSSFAEGMFVYNTATAGTTPNNVTPGLYYSNGTKWIKISDADPSGNSWSIKGNSGINAGTDFLGTTDNNPLVIKTQNTERLRITETGSVGIGTNTPQAALHVKGQAIIDTLTPGNLSTDSILVAAPLNGRVKMVSPANFLKSVQKILAVVATTGQTIFNTPATITDPTKVSLYRNGILISFSVVTANSIAAEIACVQGDEIRIIQIL